MRFGLKVPGLTTGAVAGTYTTILALTWPNTAGCRGRLRRLLLGGGGGAPQDMQVSVQCQRSNGTTAGTSTAVNVNTIDPFDSNSAASSVSAIGTNFSAEPTVKENGKMAGGAFNSRGVLQLEWNEFEGPVIGPNQTLTIQATPGSAAAVTLDAYLEWEEGF